MGVASCRKFSGAPCARTSTPFLHILAMPLDCTYQPPTIAVKRGQSFVVSVVAGDQVNKTIPFVTISSFLPSRLGGIAAGQANQTTNQSCTGLEYNIVSPSGSENLVTYADGPCKDSGPSQTFVKVSFIGFQPDESTNSSCICQCDKLISRHVHNCYAVNQTVLRKDNSWITYMNTTTSMGI